MIVIASAGELRGTPTAFWARRAWCLFKMNMIGPKGKTIFEQCAKKIGESFMIVFCTAGHCRSFVRKGPLRAFEEELYQEATWYLVDAKEPSLYDAKTILTTRPRREIWKVMVSPQLPLHGHLAKPCHEMVSSILICVH